MAQLQVIWDVLFNGQAVTKKGSDKEVAAAMDAHLGAVQVASVLRWNTVLEGQKVAAAGFTSGLRYMIPIDDLDSQEVQALVDSLGAFTNSLVDLSKYSIAEALDFPLSRSVKARFPVLGKIALQTKFTNGLGYTDHTKIKSSMKNQTKDTKNGLDPTREGKGSSSSLFSDAFRSLLSDSNWFLVLSTSTEDGVQPPESVLSRGSDGGMYELNYDLREFAATLTEESKSHWWTPLDPEDIYLNPQLTFDPSEQLDSEFDPSGFHHHGSKIGKIIENVIDWEKKQSGNDDFIEELEYTLGRLSREKRLSRNITGKEHGLVSGLESGIITNKVILPWVSEEFVNCLAFFIMTRKPQYWRNGQSQIHLIHPSDGVDIDLLMNQ